MVLRSASVAAMGLFTNIVYPRLNTSLRHVLAISLLTPIGHTLVPNTPVLIQQFLVYPKQDLSVHSAQMSLAQSKIVLDSSTFA